MLEGPVFAYLCLESHDAKRVRGGGGDLLLTHTSNEHKAHIKARVGKEPRTQSQHSFFESV